MANYPYIFCNRNGIPCIESQGVNLTDTGCTFTFLDHPFRNQYFQGMIVVKINQDFTAPATAVPIQFSTPSAAISTNIVKTYDGANVTTATWKGRGIYLVFYDRTTDTLQLIG